MIRQKLLKSIATFFAVLLVATVAVIIVNVKAWRPWVDENVVFLTATCSIILVALIAKEVFRHGKIR